MAVLSLFVAAFCVLLGLSGVSEGIFHLSALSSPAGELKTISSFSS